MPPTPPTRKPQSLQGLMQRVRECNYGLHDLHSLVPLVVGGKMVGRMRPEFAAHLRRFPDVFQSAEGTLAVHSRYSNQDDRSRAVAEVLETLCSEGVITGWRDELYPVTTSYYDEPCMLVERAAAEYLGVFGARGRSNGPVAGYVKHDDGSMSMWLGKRSSQKLHWAGKLDHIAAGGLPHGISPTENMVKECHEEAHIPEELARRASPVGVVTYENVSEVGYALDVLFCYDLPLPSDFSPEPLDGEVEEFQLMPVDQVVEILSSGTKFKTNCSLVIIDFLIRHGVIMPEQPGYLELVSSIRSGHFR
eukprot:gene107-5519_t